MPTGACGINCDVCRLNVLGVCLSCGPGNSMEAQQKMAVQVRVLGAPCPILECASNRGIDHCLRDCEEFPCERFQAYPFSEGFVKMQERRRNEADQKLDPTKEKIHVPPHYWEDLEKKDMAVLCENALARAFSSEDIVLPILGQRNPGGQKEPFLEAQESGRVGTGEPFSPGASCARLSSQRGTSTPEP